ncbi:unnamed protein product [Cylindrotheca closterium]|uniref:PDEase domain-containing protein n=1 Tax=Cylindrotheca closterium TaxID=2856 RepID=A0AAD2FTT6_9STRA|nr:unnamed protein product [Cylindrotheca closterium]
MDKSMQQDRMRRWEDCLSPGPNCDCGRLKTSILEQLIQAADISHTMQDWEIYQRWNRKLYKETTFAFQCERGANDPSDFWHKGEFGFFDFVVIPLATRLAQHPVFAKAGQEMLRNAKRNREEWQRSGETAVMKYRYAQ